MRRPRTALVLAILFSAIVSKVPHADALSCAEHERSSPAAIIAGSERLSTGDAFFDRYDYAVLGTVTDITTDETPGSERYGATVVTLDVQAVFGRSSGSARIDIGTGDPGWLVGYPFTVGTSYFVPIDEGAEFQSSLCDPISVVPHAGRAAESLTARAAEVGLESAVRAVLSDASLVRGQRAESPPAAGPDDVDGQSMSSSVVRYTIAGLSIALLAVLVALGLVRRGRRRRCDPTASPADFVGSDAGNVTLSDPDDNLFNTGEV